MAAAKKTQIVSAPLVIAKREDGSDVYVYRGSPLPEGLADGEEKRLEEFLGDAASADGK
jgi:hypothetical protein